LLIVNEIVRISVEKEYVSISGILRPRVRACVEQSVLTNVYTFYLFSSKKEAIKARKRSQK